mmetsp:Transcript_38660/g.81025  ORF Transcript_38660/g.81025 Transcript_38660/m.81025 type:complete len:351 (-) Transcript_38660:5-1057(-)
MAPQLFTNSSETGVGDNDNGQTGIDAKGNSCNECSDGSVGEDDASERKSVHPKTVADPTTNTEDDTGGAVTSSHAADTNTNPKSNQHQVAFENTNQILANSDNNSEMVSQQLAAAASMNKIQAQLISQYQLQLTALQTQLAKLSQETQFEIYVSKDTFKFNAAHFVAYPGFRERLHGHCYRVSVKLLGGHQIGGDGYVLDFGCVKSVTKDVCKKLNEYFVVPMLSDVLTIVVGEDKDNNGGSVTITTEEGSTFVFPRQDCVLMPIMHSTAEEFAIYIYGEILDGLDADYLLKRGVRMMEVTVSEAAGQDAIFRTAIPASGKSFDVASYISKEKLPEMRCATDTEGVEIRK